MMLETNNHFQTNLREELEKTRVGKMKNLELVGEWLELLDCVLARSMASIASFWSSE